MSLGLNCWYWESELDDFVEVGAFFGIAKNYCISEFEDWLTFGGFRANLLILRFGNFSSSSSEDCSGQLSMIERRLLLVYGIEVFLFILFI